MPAPDRSLPRQVGPAEAKDPRGGRIPTTKEHQGTRMKARPYRIRGWPTTDAHGSTPMSLAWCGRGCQPRTMRTSCGPKALRRRRTFAADFRSRRRIRRWRASLESGPGKPEFGRSITDNANGHNRHGPEGHRSLLGLAPTAHAGAVPPTVTKWWRWRDLNPRAPGLCTPRLPV